MKILRTIFLCSALLLPMVTFAAVTFNSVSINGMSGSQIHVNPGDNITVSVTAQLTNGDKWKGTGWGIDNNGTTPTCTNTKNAKDGTRDNKAGVFTETLIAKAPKTPGVYSINLLANLSNNCGEPESWDTIDDALVVGNNTVPPVIAPHSDITIQLQNLATGITVAYTNPTATDQFGHTVPVSCTPSSGSFFSVGNTPLTCTAKDAWGNVASPSYFTVSVLGIPPVIAAHQDVATTTTSSLGMAVAYTLPAVTNNYNGATITPTCTPVSDSLFPLGTTTVTCSAQDSAGDAATSTTFSVVVTLVNSTPTPFTIASQPDESFLCAPDWNNCFAANSQEVIPLGIGAGLQRGTSTIQRVTIAKDETSPYVSQPWFIEIICYTDASYTNTCPDWVAGNAWNGNQHDLMLESATSTTDNKHWTAYFTDPTHEQNFDGTSPVQFNPNYYYQLIINDNGWTIGAYGSQLLQQISWVLTGIAH